MFQYNILSHAFNIAELQIILLVLRMLFCYFFTFAIPVLGFKPNAKICLFAITFVNKLQQQGCCTVLTRT